MNKKNAIITIISVLILTCLFAYARTTTTDLLLVKPTWTENIDILDDINANSDILEAFANDPLKFDTGERLEDRVGAMFSGNTETGLTITYQDADNTIDVVIGANDIVEFMLKFVNEPADEDIFTYESTTGDFEWHTPGELGLMEDADINTFAKLQAWVTDKTLVNEEDVFTIDANWVNTANPWADNEVVDDITITAADTTDTTCFVALWETITGAQKVKSNAALTYNAGTGVLASTAFTGNLLGNVTGAVTGNADTCTTASAGDAAVGFFGAGVDAVTNATECTDLEGTLLSIATGTLNAAIPADHITYDMMQDITATDKILGRSTAGAGTIEEIACTSAGRDILDDANASAQRTTLGLVIGTNVLAEQSIGIADDYLLEVDDADAADNDYAKFTANGLEGRSYTEVMTDLSATSQTSTNATVYCNFSTGNDTTGDGSSSTPYATIQKCIDELPTIIAHDIIIAVGADETTTASLDLAGHYCPKTLTIKAMDTSDNNLYDSGTADVGGGNNELDDTSKAWDADEWNGGYVYIWQGTGAGQLRSISDTTTTQLIVSVNWTTNPDATSGYTIVMVSIIGDSVTIGIKPFIDNMTVQGFRWKTFSSYCILNTTNGRNLSVYDCLFRPDTGGGVFIQAVDGGNAWRNIFFVPNGKIGLSYYVMASGTPRQNCYVAESSGSGYGLKSQRISYIDMGGGANVSTFIDLHTGITAAEGGIVRVGASQTFVNCTNDYTPIGASDPAYIN